MDNLKKLVREQLSKKKVKLSEQSDPEVINARKALFNVADERLLQALRSLEGVGQVGDFLVDMIEFVNKVSPAPNITRQLAHQYIDKSMTDEFVRDDEESEGFEDEIEMEIPSDEEIVDEMSTSNAAGSYLTKAAFKPKYGYKVVKKKSEKDS